ncbi:MAG: AAA family ATPase [Deltaproteobacteria bacterium]|nr:AAA family ATPase [Deltaproteobacteria bacterium]
MALLGQHAPTWLVQMPALLSAAELEALQRKVVGAARERMLRELAEAVEALTAERPLVLVLEDLQWSDPSTLDLLSVLAQRGEPARLLVIGTYRPVEVIVGKHPLKAVKSALQLHGQCQGLRLELLSEADIAEYLAQRFPVGARRAVPVQKLAQIIHRHTDGNPLFMVNVVDSLVRQGVVVEVDGRWEVKGEVEEVGERVPENLLQLIVQQSERLSAAEQRVLAAASVAGVEFSAAAVAAGLEEGAAQVEERCEELVRREQFLQARGPEEWPDGTVAGRYRFLHALYQEVVYKRVPVGQRLWRHRRIGEREEAAYGSRARESSRTGCAL